MKPPKFKITKDVKYQIVFEEPMPEELLTYLHVNCHFEDRAVDAAVELVLEQLIDTGNLYKEDGVWKCRIVV